MNNVLRHYFVVIRIEDACVAKRGNKFRSYWVRMRVFVTQTNGNALHIFILIDLNRILFRFDIHKSRFFVDQTHYVSIKCRPMSDDESKSNWLHETCAMRVFLSSVADMKQQQQKQLQQIGIIFLFSNKIILWTNRTCYSRCLAATTNRNATL